MDILIPSYLTPELTTAVVKAFLKKDSKNSISKIVVVENSNISNYFEDLKCFSEKIFITNNLTKQKGSLANAEAIEFGRKYCQSEYIFLAHSDSAPLSPNFYTKLNLFIKKGYSLVGTLTDKIRIGAIHSSGMLVKSSLLSKDNIYPKHIRKLPKYWEKVYLQDVCDPLTFFVREHSLKHYCFQNTFNGYSLDKKAKNYKLLSKLDTAMDSKGNPLYVHLGRGTPKTLGSYKIKGKVSPKQFINLIN